MKNKYAVELGSIKTEKKSESAKRNGRNWQKPHFKKVRFFEKNFPHKLINNEWKDKFAIGKTKTGRIATYNPDYFCPDLDCYIEVTTSGPNMAEQGWKWEEAMKRGLKLKVYWWQGEDFTNKFTDEK